MPPRKKITPTIKPISLNTVLSKQSSLLEELLSTNKDLRDVLNLIAKERNS